MTTVFLSGSRKISRLNDEIRRLLNNMIAKAPKVVVGDASGADKAMQKYLSDKSFSDVVIFHSGENCRNNIGNWPTHEVHVPPGVKGREFYTLKDKELAKQADYALVLWDGKSPGSVSNILEMLQANKKVVVYFAPEKSSFQVTNLKELDNLLEKCPAETFKELDEKVHIKRIRNELSKNTQIQMSV